MLWAFVTYTSLPNGLLLLAFWLAAWCLVQRPRPWSEVGRGGVAVAVAVLIVALVPTIVAALGGTRPVTTAPAATTGYSCGTA